MSSFRALGEVIGERGLFCSLYADRAEPAITGTRLKRAARWTRTSRPRCRALQQLGIELIAAYSPEARGRSERMFGTLPPAPGASGDRGGQPLPQGGLSAPAQRPLPDARGPRLRLRALRGRARRLCILRRAQCSLPCASRRPQSVLTAQRHRHQMARATARRPGVGFADCLVPAGRRLESGTVCGYSWRGICGPRPGASRLQLNQSTRVSSCLQRMWS